MARNVGEFGLGTLPWYLLAWPQMGDTQGDSSEMGPVVHPKFVSRFIFFDHSPSTLREPTLVLRRLNLRGVGTGREAAHAAFLQHERAP